MPSICVDTSSANEPAGPGTRRHAVGKPFTMHTHNMSFDNPFNFGPAKLSVFIFYPTKFNYTKKNS